MTKGCYTDPCPVVAFLAGVRARKGMTVAELSRRTGISERSFGRWEDGETAPDADNLTDWANAFGFELALVRKVT